MRNIKTTTTLRKTALIGCSLLTLSLAACDGKDDTNTDEKAEKKGIFFISAAGESANYILRTDSLETGDLKISDNVKQLEQAIQTWIFNDDPSVAVGLIYQQGDPGICLGISADAGGTLKEPVEFQITSRFTSYGFFESYALTTVGGQTPADDTTRKDYATVNFIDLSNNFHRDVKSIPTRNITGNGEQATFSGIVDMGNGEFLTGLVVSQPPSATQTGGASTGTITCPDSVWVAAFDKDLNLKRIYRSDKLSYAAGRMRSQYYSQIDKDDDGNVYVFSGSYESSTTKPCGALRIKKNATDFDPDYYFNIDEKTGGYRFRKVWHVTKSYFMLELYNEANSTGATAAATQYGIVDAAARTFAWVTGIPAKDVITGTGLPVAHDGKMYFPIVAAGADPAIYVIDPATAVAKKGISVSGASAISAVGRLAY